MSIETHTVYAFITYTELLNLPCIDIAWLKEKLQDQRNKARGQWKSLSIPKEILELASSLIWNRFLVMSGKYGVIMDETSDINRDSLTEICSRRKNM